MSDWLPPMAGVYVLVLAIAIVAWAIAKTPDREDGVYEERDDD